MAAKDRKVRVLLGTRKGGYIAESNAQRKKWAIRGPFHAGNDVYHVVADPRHPGDLYAAVNNSWWGPMLFRSTNWGKQWKEIAPPGMPVQSKRKPPQGDPSKEVRPIVNLWHIEPGHASEPNTLFLGIDPASLFRSDDRGRSWEPVRGLNEHATRSKWGAGAGGMCLHTILIDPDNPKRMYVGISAAGTFRTDDAGEHWKPANHGVKVSFLPEKMPEVGQCVHKVALDPGNADTLYRQDHDGIYVSHDGMEEWKRVGGKLPIPHDFGFVVATAPAHPGEAYFAPLNPETRTMYDGRLQIYRWRDGDQEFSKLVRASGEPGDVGTHREGLAADALDPAHLYLGTTTGQLFHGSVSGGRWEALPYRFPGVHSVATTSP